MAWWHIQLKGEGDVFSSYKSWGWQDKLWKREGVTNIVEVFIRGGGWNLLPTMVQIHPIKLRSWLNEKGGVLKRGVITYFYPNHFQYVTFLTQSVCMCLFLFCRKDLILIESNPQICSPQISSQHSLMSTLMLTIRFKKNIFFPTSFMWLAWQFICQLQNIVSAKENSQGVFLSQTLL